MDNYKRGMTYLNDHFPFFTVVVSNLGRPVVNNHVVGKVGADHEFLEEGTPIYEVPTLQVQRNKDDNQFELVINERFLDDLSDAEVAATLAHESFHITLSHLNEVFSLDPESKEFGKDKKKMVLAQECIVNDNVTNEGFKLPDLRMKSKETGELKGGLFFGPDVVKRNVAYYSTREVMDLIEDDNEQLQQMGGDGENEHYVIMSDEDLKDLQDQISKGVRHAVFEGKIDPDDIDSDEMKSVLKIDGKGKKAGTSKSKTQRHFEKMGISINWFRYLRRLDPSAFRDGGNMGDLKTSWHAPRKKTAYMLNQGVRLPQYRNRFSKNNVGNLKPQIVFALDFSGSIPREMTEVMANLARAVPDGIEIHCCTFSTEFVPFDHKRKDEQETASGGTDFSAVQQYVNSLNLRVQPNVVVVTDGEARFGSVAPTQDIMDKRWNWLLIDPRNKMYAQSHVKDSTVEYLNDYLLGK